MYGEKEPVRAIARTFWLTYFRKEVEEKTRPGNYRDSLVAAFRSGVDDGQGDWWQEVGRPSLCEVNLPVFEVHLPVERFPIILIGGSDIAPPAEK